MTNILPRRRTCMMAGGGGRWFLTLCFVILSLPISALNAQDITFTSNTWLAQDNTNYAGWSVTVDGVTLTVDGTHTFSNLTLINNAVVTHPAGSNGVRLIVSDTLTVSTGSTIDATGRGNEADPAYSGRSGGSYGGRGQDYINESNPTYGDPYFPVDLGYGGHRASGASPRGGGAVWIRTTNLVFNGTIRANGATGSSKQSGGGSGGSILIEAGTLSGTGSMQANGGYVGSMSGQGGGGRIAVFYDNANDFDLNRIECSAHTSGGGPGTIYLRDRGASTGRMLVDNRDRTHNAAIPTPLPVTTNWFDRLAVRRGARVDLAVGNGVNLTHVVVSNAHMTVTGGLSSPDLVLNIEGTAALYHPAGYSNGLRIVAATVTLDAAATINATGRGNEADPELSGRSGGSYGGRGQNYIGNSIPVYGDPYFPLDLGSGGQRESGASARGGGAVWLRATNLVVNGTVQANGSNGTSNRGGGSGGSILIEADFLSGAGSLQANGGQAGGSLAGHGGGGRIAVYYADKTGFVPAHFETKASSGAEWGTVFFAGPRKVSVLSAGLGTVTPAGVVSVPFQSNALFQFEGEPPFDVKAVYNNGIIVGRREMREYTWHNEGVWRETLDDASWLDWVVENDRLEARFSFDLQGATADMLGDGSVEIRIPSVSGWMYSLWRCDDLTQPDWQPVPGQTNVLSDIMGSIVLTDTNNWPRAFFKVMGQPTP